MPVWLWRSIVSLSASIALVSILQWGACRFYVLPTIWPWYAKSVATDQASNLDVTPMGCMDVDTRTTSVLMGLLTTLMALSRKAD